MAQVRSFFGVHVVAWPMGNALIFAPECSHANVIIVYFGDPLLVARDEIVASVKILALNSHMADIYENLFQFQLGLFWYRRIIGSRCIATSLTVPPINFPGGVGYPAWYLRNQKGSCEKGSWPVWCPGPIYKAWKTWCFKKQGPTTVQELTKNKYRKKKQRKREIPNLKIQTTLKWRKIKPSFFSNLAFFSVRWLPAMLLDAFLGESGRFATRHLLNNAASLVRPAECGWKVPGTFPEKEIERDRKMRPKKLDMYTMKIYIEEYRSYIYIILIWYNMKMFEAQPWPFFFSPLPAGANPLIWRTTFASHRGAGVVVLWWRKWMRNGEMVPPFGWRFCYVLLTYLGFVFYPSLNWDDETIINNWLTVIIFKKSFKAPISLVYILLSCFSATCGTHEVSYLFVLLYMWS